MEKLDLKKGILVKQIQEKLWPCSIDLKKDACTTFKGDLFIYLGLEPVLKIHGQSLPKFFPFCLFDIKNNIKVCMLLDSDELLEYFEVAAE
jgi:hypothetical protein